MEISKGAGGTAAKAAANELDVSGMKITAFCCSNALYDGLKPGEYSRAYVEGVQIVETPCSGKVDPIYLLKAFERGRTSSSYSPVTSGCAPRSRGARGSTSASRARSSCSPKRDWSPSGCSCAIVKLLATQSRWMCCSTASRKPPRNSGPSPVR